ncbi:MAG TPA: hypothetical protein VFU80_01050 [Sphingomicrobium sp.]|nr:hypothetical protein [Sphingomicrobium sp.]
MVNGLEDDEFSIPGHVVADVALIDGPEKERDGSIALTIEALTVQE